MQAALFNSKTALSGWELAADFKNGQYRFQGNLSRDPASLPGYSMVRNGVKFEEVNGILIPVASQQPAIIPGVGYIARPSYINYLPNSNFAGGYDVNGNISGMNVGRSTVNGVTRQPVSTGFFDLGNGTVLPYIDYRIFGKATADANLYPVFSGTNNASMPDAIGGERWTASLGVRLLPGGLMPGCRIQAVASARSRDGNTIYGTYAVDLMNLGEWKLNNDWVVTRTPELPTTVGTAQSPGSMWMFLAMFIPSGATVDYTIRIFAPSLVKNFVRGPYIPTSSGAVTLPGDRMRMTMPADIPAAGDFILLTSVVHQYIGPSEGAAGSTRAVGHLSFGSSGTNQIFLFTNTTGTGATGVVNDSGQYYRSASGLTAPPERMVIVLAYQGGQFRTHARSASTALSIGSAVATTVPTGSATVSFGTNTGGGEATNGVIEFAGYRRGRFTDSEIAALVGNFFK